MDKDQLYKEINQKVMISRDYELVNIDAHDLRQSDVFEYKKTLDDDIPPRPVFRQVRLDKTIEIDGDLYKFGVDHKVKAVFLCRNEKQGSDGGTFIDLHHAIAEAFSIPTGYEFVNLPDNFEEVVHEECIHQNIYREDKKIDEVLIMTYRGLPFPVEPFLNTVYSSGDASYRVGIEQHTEKVYISKCVKSDDGWVPPAF